MGKNISVYGIFASRSALERAVVGLQQSGFRNEDVSVLLPENLGNKDLVTEKSSKGPEGAVTGGATGGVVGGHSAGWPASVRSPSRGWGPLSQRDRSWPPSPALAPELLWAA